MSGTASPAVSDGREYTLRPEGRAPDAEGHVRFFVDLRDEDRFLEALRKRRGEPGSTRVEIAPADEADTQGHGTPLVTAVIVRPQGDDTKGHAISLHFPTTKEAAAFRRRLFATGLIVGTVTIGAVGATALPGLHVGTNADRASVGERATTPDADIGIMDSPSDAAANAMALRAAAADRANSDIGLMDPSGRPATTEESSSTPYVPPERPGRIPR